jgi:predicted transcriptional regulator
MMNIEAEKLKLIEWLLSLRDETTIEKLKFLHENLSDSTDWWDTISENEKESIDRGIKDIKEGKTIPHSEVKKKYDKWL